MSSRIVIGTAAGLATLLSYSLYNREKKRTPSSLNGGPYLTQDELFNLRTGQGITGKVLQSYHLPNYQDKWSSKLKDGIFDDFGALWRALLFQKNQMAQMNGDVMLRDLERGKRMAVKNYNDAVRVYNQYIDDYKEHDKSWLYDSIRHQVEKARNELDDAVYQFKHFGENLEDSDTLSNTTSKFKESWNNIKPGKTVDPEEVDKIVASQSVYGWGENAQEFAREEMEENVRRQQQQTDAAAKKLKAFKQNALDKGWFLLNKDKVEEEEQVAENALKGLEGWGENAAQFAKDEYEDIKWQLGTSKESLTDKVDKSWEKMADAKKKLDETQAKWWEFGQKKNNELYEEAKRQYDLAETDYQKARKKLSEWNDKMWEKTDSSIHTLKEGSEKANEKIQSGLSKTQNYIRDQ
ncbi:hypothetical protein NCAS_0B06610 [Naumovozyma castellii]|uniref:Uncharacterized protein n=1 Tax=Naumovozyma castellii TaxID=27288 RepID=G0V9X8_NAUCA|nr:hypothetical protein NCAS_0B06610 [Naumovozyma castellii CBS 4309]CCC68745.1 hypothetical protein NCAS_0B06610 [Naumovozyma castellii CBS 4309]